jgi:hypothetical protein
MAIHFYDPDDGQWKTMTNPSCGDIAELLVSVSRARPCERCDASAEYAWPGGGGPPSITVIHERDCPDAA